MIAKKKRSLFAVVFIVFKLGFIFFFANFRPADSRLDGFLLRHIFIVRMRAVVKAHDDIRPDRELHLNAFLRGEDDLLFVLIRTDDDLVFSDRTVFFYSPAKVKRPENRRNRSKPACPTR
jgi:hypothetical protein